MPDPTALQHHPGLFVEIAQGEIAKMVTRGLMNSIELLNSDRPLTGSDVANLMSKELASTGTVVDTVVSIFLMVETTTGYTRVDIETQRVEATEARGVGVEVRVSAPTCDLLNELAELARWAQKRWPNVSDVDIHNNVLSFFVPATATVAV